MKSASDLFFKSSATELRNAEEIGPVIPPENGSGGPNSPSYGKGGYRPLSLANDGAAIQRVGNDKEFLRENTPGIPILGFLPSHHGIQEADRLGISVYDHVPELRQSAEEITKELDLLIVKE